MKTLFAMAVIGHLSTAYANTNSGSKLFVSAQPQNVNLDAAGFAALTFVEVKGIGNHGETGTSQNIVSYDTWDGLFSQKAKGIADAGSPDVEVARIPSDPGQRILRNAGVASNNSQYAFKIVRNDAPTGGTGTVEYNRGIVTGPRAPNGGNEDFILEIFTLGLNQERVVVDATDMSITATVPSTASEGGTLTITPTVTGGSGTKSYEWNGTDLAPYDITINATTGVLSSSDIGKTGTVSGVIIVTDSTGAKAYLTVNFTVT